MSWLIELGILAAGFILTTLLAAYQLSKQKPAPPDAFQNPKTASGLAIPVLYGTWRLRPIITWFGGTQLHEVKKSTTFLGGLASNSAVVGYMYGVNLQGVLCWGKIDSVENMVFGDKALLSDQAPIQISQDETTQVTQNAIEGGRFARLAGVGVDSIEVYAGGKAASLFFLPNVYGGYGRGGGVRGFIELNIGSLQYGPDTFLVGKIGAGNVPSYGDLVTVIYADLIVGESPVPPAIDYVFYREPRPEYIIPGGSGSPAVNARWITHISYVWRMVDLNAAAIIYDVLVNPLYGLGFSPDQIAGAGVGVSNGLSGTFEDAQRGLVAEGMGMSMLCGGAGEQTTAQAIIDECLRTADAVLLRDPATFQWKLRLMRNEAPDATAFAALRSFSETTGIRSCDWTMPGLRETINQVTVEFSDAERMFKSNTVTLRNEANVAMTSSIRKKRIQYLAVTDVAVAMKICARDLKAASIPLGSGTIKVSRAAWDLERGDVFKLNFAEHGLVNRQVRVVAVDLGDPSEPEISVDVVDDVFQFDDFQFTRISVPPGGFPHLPTIIIPSVISTTLTRTGSVGSLAFTILDPEHRITEVADRTQVAGGAVSAWNVVATAGADTTDSTFPYNNHVTDGDMNGTVVVTVPLSAAGDSVIEYRLTYIGYATVAAPLSDMRTVQDAVVFSAAAGDGSTITALDGTANPIIWDVTGKTDDSASATISGNRSLVILGAVAGFRGKLLITSTGAGGYTFTLPAGSIYGDGSSLNVTLGFKDQLTVYFDGTYYWWNLVTHATTLPPIALDATLTIRATLTASIRSLETSMTLDGTTSGDLTL
jgi:hypothetical protein